MLRRTVVTGALATCTVLALAAPVAAQTDAGHSARVSGSSTVLESGNDGARLAPRSEKLAAGEIRSFVDAFDCTSFGGANGRGYIGSRGYMEELGATNATRMAINIVTQQKFTTRPFWRNVAGTGRTWTYDFAGAPNSASHSLLAPGPGLVWAKSFTLSDDANNYIYRQKLKFTWSNAVSRVSRQAVTPACFSD